MSDSQNASEACPRSGGGTSEMCPLRPRGNFAVVRRLRVAGVTHGGIAIPGTSQTPMDKGVVLALGPGEKIIGPDGRVHLVPPADVAVGDLVHFGERAGVDVTVNRREYTLIPASSLAAVQEVPDEAPSAEWEQLKADLKAGRL